MGADIIPWVHQKQRRCAYAYRISDQVIKNGMWDLATCSDGEPNVVPVAFKDVTEDGKLVVGDVFLETTLVETIIGLRRTDS